MHPTNLTRGHPPRSSRPPSRVSAWEKGKHSHLSLTYHKNCGSSCSLLITTPLTLSLKKITLLLREVCGLKSIILSASPKGGDHESLTQKSAQRLQAAPLGQPGQLCTPTPEQA